MPGDDRVVLVERQRSIRTTTLSHADVLNTFSGGLLAPLEEVIREAEQGQAVRCVPLTGGGNAGHGVRAVPGDIQQGTQHLRQLAPCAAIGQCS